MLTHMSVYIEDFGSGEEEGIAVRVLLDRVRFPSGTRFIAAHPVALNQHTVSRKHILSMS